ncbi:MAG TPA: DUF4013 domain-containing protein [Methanobacteriaceae archaeon]|nr:DUF4013 domain-containing protein [Methanobacteriaceae archaeon]
MDSMNLKDIVKDSFRYAAASWYNVILLGIVLLLADHLVDANTGLIDGWLDFVLLIIALALAVLEAGYAFRMLEETVNGSVKPPKINRIFSLFSHGIREIVVTVLYFFTPIVLFFLGFDLISAFVEINLGALNTILGWDIDQLTFMVFFGLFFILISGISIIFEGALLNMANNHGTIRSAFNFPHIFYKLKKIGFKRLLLIYLITLVLLSIIQGIISDSLHQLPVIGDILLTLIITPYLLMVTTRMLGLIDAS